MFQNVEIVLAVVVIISSVIYRITRKKCVQRCLQGSFVAFLIVVLSCEVSSLVKYTDKVALGDGYYFVGDVSECIEFTREAMGLFEDTMTNRIIYDYESGYVRNRINGFRTPKDVDIKAVEYGDKYIIAKGNPGLDKNAELYWVIVKRKNKIKGPLSKQEFLDCCEEYNLEPLNLKYRFL